MSLSSSVSAAQSTTPLPSEWGHTGTQKKLRLRPLEAWHLLSLDAPTVATVWLIFAAAHPPTRLPPTLAVTMFLAVWLLYACDRLLDAWAGLRGRTPAHELAARHLFHHRHRAWFGGVVFGVALVILPLISTLPAPLLHGYASLGALMLGWLALVHGAPQLRARLLRKEIAVGIFFAPAVLMPELLPGDALRADAGAATLLMMMICAVNCLSIAHWEEAAEGGRVMRSMRPFALLLAVICLVTTIAVHGSRGPWQIFAALCLAGLLLAALDLLRSRLTATTLRAAADLVLLTPLLFGLMH